MAESSHAIVLSSIIVCVICTAVSYGIDGVCSPTNDAAIRYFQKTNVLKTDGIVYPRAFAKLF